MARCGNCKLYTPDLFVCPITNSLVSKGTDASACKMNHAKCGDCSKFIPDLYNCTNAVYEGRKIGTQVTEEVFACEAPSLT